MLLDVVRYKVVVDKVGTSKIVSCFVLLHLKSKRGVKSIKKIEHTN